LKNRRADGGGNDRKAITDMLAALIGQDNGVAAVAMPVQNAVTTAATLFQSSAKFREPRLPKFMIPSLLTKLCPPDAFLQRFIKTRERRPLRQRRALAANALTLLMRAARRQGMVWAVGNPV
jgi:hypothetical protein